MALKCNQLDLLFLRSMEKLTCGPSRFTSSFAQKTRPLSLKIIKINPVLPHYPRTRFTQLNAHCIPERLIKHAGGFQMNCYRCYVTSRKLSTYDNTSENTQQNQGLSSDNSDESELELDVDELRNVSRLTPNQYKTYHGLSPDVAFKDLTISQQRYAKFGTVSGEDPRIMWPSRKSVLSIEEEEKEEALGNLTERLANIQLEQKQKEERKLARRKQIEKNMGQMSKWIEEYNQKQVQAQREAGERAAKKDVLLEEAREYFGYKIKANDPKFQQMLEEKEEKEKAEAKRRKKEDKAKKLAARLAQDAAQSSSDSKGAQ